MKRADTKRQPLPVAELDLRMCSTLFAERMDKRPAPHLEQNNPPPNTRTGLT